MGSPQKSSPLKEYSRLLIWRIKGTSISTYLLDYFRMSNSSWVTIGSTIRIFSNYSWGSEQLIDNLDWHFMGTFSSFAPTFLQNWVETSWSETPSQTTWQALTSRFDRISRQFSYCWTSWSCSTASAWQNMRRWKQLSWRSTCWMRWSFLIFWG